MRPGWYVQGVLHQVLGLGHCKLLDCYALAASEQGEGLTLCDMQILLEGRTKIICFEAAQEDTIKVGVGDVLLNATVHDRQAM